MVYPNPSTCLSNVCIMEFFSSLSGSSLNILTVACFIVAFGGPFHTLIILCIKKLGTFFFFFLRAEGEKADYD